MKMKKQMLMSKDAPKKAPFLTKALAKATSPKAPAAQGKMKQVASKPPKKPV